MDALRGLTEGQGCAVDGTAAAANPLSQLVGQVVGASAQKGRPGMMGMPTGPMQMGPGGATEAERGMNAAMAGGPRGAAGFGGPMGPMGPMARGPMTGPPPQAAANGFVQEFQQQFRGVGPAMPQGLGPRGHVAGPADAWVRDFQAMNLGNPMERAYRQNFGWANEMARGPTPAQMEMERVWRQQQADGAQWAKEMAQRPAESKPAPAASPIEAPAATSAPPLDASAKADLTDAWTQLAGGEPQDVEEALARAWERGEEPDLEKLWTDMMKQAGLEGQLPLGVDGDLSAAWSQSALNVPPEQQPYELTKDNPFAKNKAPYEEGMRLFQEGRLHDAMLAFHATVEQDPTHADAWRMLGVVHQENDEDKKAIVCLERAVEQDAYHLDALLALGVSYVNELNHERALRNLKAWVVNNPAFQGIEVKEDAYSDGSLMDDVMQLMLKAAAHAPNDAGVQEVLGVLYNVTHDYDSAVQAFKRALSANPDSYSLWNKLSATLANRGSAEEAIPGYLRALELRPTYARGLLNLGIAHSNLGNYDAACQTYIKALIQNPEAAHVWGYIRICLTSMNRFDLIPLSEKRDLDALRKIFNV